MCKSNSLPDEIVDMWTNTIHSSFEEYSKREPYCIGHEKTLKLMDECLDSVDDTEFLSDYHKLEKHRGPTIVEFIESTDNQDLLKEGVEYVGELITEEYGKFLVSFEVIKSNMDYEPEESKPVKVEPYWRKFETRKKWK